MPELGEEAVCVECGEPIVYAFTHGAEMWVSSHRYPFGFTRFCYPFVDWEKVHHP